MGVVSDSIRQSKFKRATVFLIFLSRLLWHFVYVIVPTFCCIMGRSKYVGCGLPSLFTVYHSSAGWLIKSLLGHNGSIQMTLFLPFQNGKNALFTVETVAERNGPIFAKQALREGGGEPDYLHRKDAVRISPVHAGSLAAASPPHPQLTYRSAVNHARYGRTLQQNSCWWGAEAYRYSWQK